MKCKLAIAAMMIGLVGTSVVTPVSAAAASTGCEKLNQNGVQVISGNNLDEIKEKLEAMGIDCPNINLPGQTLPDCNLPENPDGGNTEQPETEQPETEQPETEQPETEQPETEQPETEQPETEKPETEQPETPGSENENNDNSFASQVIDLVNQERAKEGLPALKFDEKVAKAALVRAKETETSFSHTRPNGSSFSTALTENGVVFNGAGENIAYGQKSPEEVMKGWMNSPGHRANIMNKSFTTIGVGYYENANGVKYWTQLFTN